MSPITDKSKLADGGKAKKGLMKPQAGLESIAPLICTVEETPEPMVTTVHGAIPSWINGNFLRNGPGRFEFGNTHYNHWFDGMAMLHRFKIQNGQVTYMSRFLQSDSYRRNRERDRIMISEFGTLAMPDPCKNFFQRFLSRFEMMEPTDNASVNFVKYEGDYYVSTETNFMHKVNLDNMESSEKVFCKHEDLHGDDLYDYGGLEFPQINYSQVNTQSYRYFYGCGFRHLVGDSLLKMDLKDKTLKAWHQKGFYPSEPVFVASPDAVEEDDGVILSVVLTPSQDKGTFLLVLDAKTFVELGRASVPVNMAYGFHGAFAASEQ
uniref:Carotenoid-cleaving dioxygenase, mitochondrial n=1 Tax=Nothobranchius korthausae TaxID=1143690 RepID=A0A1A8FEL6_9TELE